MHQRTIAVGVFREPREVSAAMHALKDAGFAADDIGLAVLQAPDAEGAHLTDENVHRIRIDETTGILAGGVLGGWPVG